MSKKHDITVIAGLPGVGKTYAIEALIHESDDYAHFSAGTLIKKRRANLDRDRLRELDKDNILANQYLLVEQFKEELPALDIKKRILFDAHMLIDNDQSIIEVPYEIFEQLSPVRLIFLFDDAKSILDRRKNDDSRIRPIHSISKIIEQQKESIHLAQEYSQRLSIEFYEVQSGDTAALRDAINIW